MKSRPVLLIAVLALVYALAGCGGSSDSSAPAPATVAPADSSIFVEATVLPTGTLKSNVEALAANVAGIDDLGTTVLAKVEEAAKEADEPFSYEKDVKPWLGEKAGIFLSDYDGQNFSDAGGVIQVTDTAAAQEFIDAHVKPDEGEKYEDASYEGVDYKVTSGDDSSIGIVGDFIVYAKNQQIFKAVVDASNGGEALADVTKYVDATEGAPSDGLASVYVDIGSLIKQAGPIDPQAAVFLQSAGIAPEEATATASVVPGADQVEIDLRSDITGNDPPAGDASKLVGSMPAESVAAFASPEFGKALGNLIDSIDANGIPGSIPPHKFKEGLKSAGIDLEKIVGSLGDLGGFVEGTTSSNLDGAVVLTTDNASEASNTVANIGLLLRLSHTPGITAIGGKATGFSIRSSSLGHKPIVVAAEGERISIGYGLPAALLGLSEEGKKLSGESVYKEAVSALGGTPITAFVDGPGVLGLVEAGPAAKEPKFLTAKPYLEKVSYIAAGGGVEDGLSTAKLIVGFEK